MARILAVGVATLDIINEVDSYPGEDDEVRALAQTVRRGGNATNTLVVLSQLGHDCEWAGVLADESGTGVIDADLERYRVGSRYCRRLPGGKVPTSCITLSRSAASRSIVHYRDLPEFDLDSFFSVPHATFDWIHFEGRNVADTYVMMRHVATNNPGCVLSLELEKPRPEIEMLLPFADLILTNEVLAEQRNCTPESFIKQLLRHAPGAITVCTLGRHGAMALSGKSGLIRSPAFPPVHLLDTLGAGDTFNAGMIHSRLRGDTLQTSLEFACKLAGKKCGQLGLDSLSPNDVALADD